MSWKAVAAAYFCVFSVVSFEDTVNILPHPPDLVCADSIKNHGEFPGYLPYD